MKALLLVFVLVASIGLLFAQDDGSSGNLLTLKTQFQTLLNELEGKPLEDINFDSNVAGLLSKLDRLQQTPGSIVQNLTALDWFLGDQSSSGALWLAAPLRIIIVVSSFEGMYLNSGIGTFYAALADFLINHGHTVTILYTHLDASEARSFKKWQASYEKKGINIVKLEASPIHIAASPLVQKSYQVYNYLKLHQQFFDVVHFPEWEGSGYYSVLAKHQRLAFASKILVVGLHGPWRWVKLGNQQTQTQTQNSASASTGTLMTQLQDLETDWMERKSVEMADIVLTPSVELPQWLASQGWSLPPTGSGRLFLMPFLPGREINLVNQRVSVMDSYKNSATADSKRPVKEFVFFGRLERRKGLELFSDALDQLAISKPDLSVKVTFLGRNTDIGSTPATVYLEQRAQNGGWPFTVSYITYKDRKGALEYIREEGRLAVMPSITDNAPYTVYECLYSSTPFIASNIPSISALVHPEDRSFALFPVSASSLAAKLEAAVLRGASPVRGILSVDQVLQAWSSFYDLMSDKMHTTLAKQIGTTEQNALVSVCITHYNRPHFLALALQSVLAQDYKNIEVVLVDDGSTDPQAKSYIDTLEEIFKGKNWQLIRTGNRYLGAARNTAARAARGKYLVFLDDDNMARPNWISTYVSVASSTGADICTAAHDTFQGEGLPVPMALADQGDSSLNSNPLDTAITASSVSSNLIHRSVPLGPSAAVGFFKNCFGDANFFIRRDVLHSVGGFTEEKGVGQEDHEFLAKAVLQGHTLEAIPESLLYYRMHKRENQMLYNTDPVENQVRAARPFLKVLENSGELFKMLAHHRAKTRFAEAVCNMTIVEFTPREISTMENTEITFTVTKDCSISSVMLGNYPCTNVVELSSTTFTCITSSIPLPGEYTISVIFEDNSSKDFSEYVTVVYGGTESTTSALVSLEFYAHPVDYSQIPLRDLLAELMFAQTSQITVIYDVIVSQPTNKRSHTGWVAREIRMVFSSSTAARTATAMVYDLMAELEPNRERFLNIYVELKGLNFQGFCDLNRLCQCTPSYAGVDCMEAAMCPNNCSGRGECRDGPYTRVCDCHEGFTGRDCGLQLCGMDCNNHGVCILYAGGSAYCACDPGWSGPNCTIRTQCPGDGTCSGHGTCTSGVCSCQAGWSGDSCSIELGEQHDGSTQQDADGKVAFAVVVALVGVVLLAAVIIGICLAARRNNN